MTATASPRTVSPAAWRRSRSRCASSAAAGAPLMRLNIFRVRTLAISDTVLLLVASGMFGMFFFASLYVQEILGYSPLRAGLAFLPVTAGIVIGAGLAQQLIGRLGVRNVAIGGISLATAGMAILTQLPVHGSYVGNLLVGLLPMSIGMGLTFVPITLLATGGVTGNDAGLASGLFNTAQQVGGSLGLAILSTLAASQTSSLWRRRARRSERCTRRAGIGLPRRVRRGSGDARNRSAAARRGAAAPAREGARAGARSVRGRGLTPRALTRENVYEMETERRPMRADAERNRQRLLDAAKAAFCERGLDVGVGEIAELAGVGRGTVFRNFPTKEHLIAAIVVDRMNEAMLQGRALLQAPGAGDALFAFIEEIVGRQQADYALFDAIADTWLANSEIRAAHAELIGVLDALLVRAQASAEVRADIGAVDVLMLVKGACEASRSFQHVDPEIGQRQLDLVRAAIGAPGTARELRGRTPTVDDLERAFPASGGSASGKTA